MFHILVARFLLEANENIPKKCDLNDVSLHWAGLRRAPAAG